MKKLILLIFILILTVVGCDKFRPDVHPEKIGEERGWFFGFKFFTKW